jgi:hypothetical protein
MDKLTLETANSIAKEIERCSVYEHPIEKLEIHATFRRPNGEDVVRKVDMDFDALTPVELRQIISRTLKKRLETLRHDFENL